MIWKKPLQEKHLLPTGVKEFHEWADRIISAACLTATPDSQKYALCGLLTELPVSCHAETDAYFITRLRKHAVNQVAVALREQFYKEAKERLAQKEAEATAPAGGDVLGKPGL